jgi:hypothetical protein
MPKTAPVVELIQEYASSAGLSLKVDRERGVIPGVKILGLESKNGRTYTPKCAAEAMPLYENAAVFVDHQMKGEQRSYHDRIGHLTNVTAKADGLYADLHVNPKNSIAEQLFWDAENAPSHVGLSHDCEAVLNRKDGKTLVESISRVNSVDLVAKAATVSGLFESQELPDDPEQRELCEHGFSVASDARLILLGEDTIENKKARLLEIVAVWHEELAGEPVTQKEQSMEWAEITKESLTEHRKDLVDLILVDTNKLQEDLQKLTDEVAAKDLAIKEATDKLAAMDAEKAAQAKAALIKEELKACKIDTEDPVIVSEAFMEMLNLAADADARKRLIEDRAALAKGRQQIHGAAPFASVGGASAPAKNKKELLERL